VELTVSVVKAHGRCVQCAERYSPFMSHGAEIPAGAVQAAWESVRLLDHDTRLDDRQRAQKVLDAAVDDYGRPEIGRALTFLVAVLTLSLAKRTKDDDPASLILPAMLRQLPRSFPHLPGHVLPTLAGTMTAGILGQDAVLWRDRFGAVSEEEVLGLTYLLWQLADFNDSMLSPGVTDGIVRELIAARFLEEA
jgi:hypothetical protein